MSLRSTATTMGSPAELFHWVPGEIVLVVRLARLPADEALDGLVEQVRAQLNTFLARYDLSLVMYGQGGRWLHSVTMPPIRRRAFLFGLRRRQPLAALFFHVQQIGDQDDPGQDLSSMALSYIHGHLEQFARRGLPIVSAMPNWLLTAAPLLYSEGGTIIPPVPAPKPVPRSESADVRGWHLCFAEPSLLTPRARKQMDDPVQVVILDTAQHPDRILGAVTRPELRHNWLLQRLAADLQREDALFAVDYDRYAPTNNVRTGRDYEHAPRYYVMPDHGLSLAGIVRDLAPDVHIRLVRLLNDYGGGDLYGLYGALTDLEYEMHTGALQRVIVNVSFTIMPDIRRLPALWFADRRWSNTRLMEATHVLRQIEEGLRLLFSSLAAQGALIVAAAGNDSLQRTVPCQPRAPARYSSVLGVTSINSNLLPSQYANAANVGAQRSGVAAFGGDMPRVLTDDGFPDAVRGVYIAPTFPGGEFNASGWADWRGTSFATAMVSGLSVHLMEQGLSAAAIIARLANGLEQRNEASYGTPPEIERLLANGVHIRQGYE